jgi:hypothetical protein
MTSVKLPLKPGWDALLGALAFWSLASMGFYVAGRLIDADPAVIGNRGIPFEATPRVFAFALTGIAFASLGCAFMWAMAKARRWRLLAAMITAAMVFASTLVPAALNPSAGTIRIRDRVDPFPWSREPQVFALAVFFPNGKSTMTPMVSESVRLQLAAFNSCGVGPIRVRGFASSARFSRQAIESDGLNRNLANNRAKNLQALLVSSGYPNAELTPPWDSYLDMAGQRRIRDIDERGHRLPDRELLNRRAEIFWIGANCIPQPDQQPQPASPAAAQT